MIILHLLPRTEFDALTRPLYAPTSLAAEGFVHCTDDVETLLGVANRFYRGVEGDVLVLDLDVDALGAEVLWEAPAHLDGSPLLDDEPRFPHVYGPIPVAAIIRTRSFVRADDGSYLSVAND
jgi:uncharacterized protein (DUF952 family)